MRDLTIALIRLLGLYVLCQALFFLASQLAFAAAYSDIQDLSGLESLYIGAGTSGVRAVAGLVLLLGAPGIVRRLKVPEGGGPGPVARRVVLHAVVVLAALVVGLLALGPVVRVLLRSLGDSALRGLGSDLPWVANVPAAVIQLALAVLVLYRADRLAAWLARKRSGPGAVAPREGPEPR